MSTIRMTKKQLKAAADAERNQARTRLRQHAAAQKDELFIVLAECRHSKCGGIEFATMTELMRRLAEMPSWQHDADGNRIFTQDRYEMLRDIVLRLDDDGGEIETLVMVCNDGIHRRVVRLKSDTYCRCSEREAGVVIPFPSGDTKH